MTATLATTESAPFPEPPVLPPGPAEVSPLLPPHAASATTVVTNTKSLMSREYRAPKLPAWVEAAHFFGLEPRQPSVRRPTGQHGDVECIAKVSSELQFHFLSITPRESDCQKWIENPLETTGNTFAYLLISDCVFARWAATSA